MTTSDASWSAKLRVVGDLERPDHYHLDESDRCAYFGDYTPRAGYGHSVTNQLISNLKKSPSVRYTGQWQYKLGAIDRFAAAITRNIAPESWDHTTFVPIPPSKTVGNPEYDDRIARVVRAIGNGADVRELLHTSVDRASFHTGDQKRSPEALRATLSVNYELVTNPRPYVLLIDDVLTTGCSFKVCKQAISEIWPDAQVSGLFAARRVIPNPFEDLDALFDSY